MSTQNIKVEIPNLDGFDVKDRMSMFRKCLENHKPNKIDPNLKRNLTHGWMLSYLLSIDYMTWQRWAYWQKISISNKLIPEKIPQIEFGHNGGTSTGQGSIARKHLENVLGLIPNTGNNWLSWGDWRIFEYFLDWLLFGFGHVGTKEEPQEPSQCEGASMRLYQAFNLGNFMAYPYDYFGDMLAEHNHGRRIGFFPTPHPVCEMMTKMLFHDAEASGKDTRVLTVNDPCVGTGRMLLHASNYSFRLYAQDINPIVIKCCLVNGYLYAPWLVKPFAFLDNQLYDPTASEAISDSMTATSLEKEAKNESKEPVQMSLFDGSVSAYLANTEHDSENQKNFEPIKKRRKKDKNHPFNTVFQNSLFDDLPDNEEN